MLMLFLLLHLIQYDSLILCCCSFAKLLIRNYSLPADITGRILDYRNIDYNLSRMFYVTICRGFKQTKKAFFYSLFRLLVGVEWCLV